MCWYYIKETSIHVRLSRVKFKCCHSVLGSEPPLCHLAEPPLNWSLCAREAVVVAKMYKIYAITEVHKVNSWSTFSLKPSAEKVILRIQKSNSNPADMTRKGYYSYFDEVNEAFYYYDVFTHKTTWLYPTDGIVVDPETRKPFPNPDIDDPAEEDHIPRVIVRSSSQTLPLSSLTEEPFTFKLEIDEEVKNFVPPKPEPEPQPHPHPLQNKTSFVMPSSDQPRYIPSDMMNEIHQFQIRDFADMHFQRCSKRRLFTRAMVSLDSIVSFDPQPIKKPLLNKLPKKSSKSALKCFQLILQYAGVNQKRDVDAAPAMIRLVEREPELRDEVYFQLIKQTKQCPESEWERRFWELFLMMATIFPSTRNSEDWIKSYLANSSQSSDVHIAMWAQFCYIRFCARCAIGQPLEYSAVRLAEIPQEPRTSVFLFGVSLYEIMWGQRRSLPNCPVPVFLHQLAEAMFEAGAEKIEGIFRLPGNMRNVDRLAELANMGENIMNNIPLHDIASLLKKWVRELAEPIVPKKMNDRFMEAGASGDWLAFVDKLPQLHMTTLAYLIGFLQRLSKAQAVTKMGPDNLAMVFGPNVVQPGTILLNEKTFVDKSKQFLLFLIENWDVSAVYPLNVEV